jgi:hypothetical protein
VSIIVKILETLSRSAKMSENIKRLSRDYDMLSREMKVIDRRLTRLETYLEIAEKNRQFHIKEIL